LLDTWSRLRTEQEGHLATTQNGPMLGDVCKAREKKILLSQWTIKSKGSAYRKGATNASLDAENAALQKEVSQLKRQLGPPQRCSRSKLKIRVHAVEMISYRTSKPKLQSRRVNREEGC